MRDEREKLQMEVKEQRAKVREIALNYRSCRTSATALAEMWDRAHATLRVLELRLAKEEGRWDDVAVGCCRKTAPKLRKKAVEELVGALNRDELLALITKLTEEVGGVEGEVERRQAERRQAERRGRE